MAEDRACCERESKRRSKQSRTHASFDRYMVEMLFEEVAAMWTETGGSEQVANG